MKREYMLMFSIGGELMAIQLNFLSIQYHIISWAVPEKKKYLKLKLNLNARSFVFFSNIDDAFIFPAVKKYEKIELLSL